MEDYFEKAKKELESKIPDYESSQFKKMRDKIKKELKKKENELLILVRRFKILILGDWNTEEKKKVLIEIKDTLLNNGLYAETIDKYYNMNKKGGLSQKQILESCCVNHQLIVLIDGSGAGTLTEQNYLADNYIFHGKVIFFIDENKFNKLKDSPSEYIKDFPTIITYTKNELVEKALVYPRFRLYRLAGIIQKQSSSRKGMFGSRYVPWAHRLGR